jgi:3-hydroxyisobutyrate dehydrogenase-like beta-hydroxyacid dehydrogenase
VDLGFVGLGEMGSGIARRLLRAGFRVTGWNRTRAKAVALRDAGLVPAGSAGEAAAAADVLFTMITDAAALDSLVDELVASLRPGAVWADLSTIAPDESRALAARAQARGVSFLDSPVSGSPATLAAGQLSVMVGGERAAFERVRPVLEAIGPKVIYLGPSGSALVMKLAINVSLVVQGMSFCESVAMAEKAGVERAAAVEAVLNSVIASPMLGYRGPMILAGGLPERPFADVALQQKDQQLGLRLAARLGTPLPFASLANEFLTACRAAGYGDEEWIAVYEVFRRLGGGE